MTVLDDIGGLINNVRLIIQSNPDRLNDFAQRWAQVAAAAQGQQPVVMRGITDVEFNSEGALAKRMTEYRLQLGDGMAKLGDGTMEVADALRQAAPRLATIRKDLIAAAVGAGLTAAALAIPVVGEVLEGLVAGGEIVTIVNLVNDYNTEMTALNGSFTTAQAKMQALDTLNANGGVLPDAPAVGPGDVGPGPTSSNGQTPGSPSSQSPSSQSPGTQSPGGDTPGGTPASTPTGTPGADTPGGATPSIPGADTSTDPSTQNAVPSLDSSTPDPSIPSSSIPLPDPSLSASTPSTLDTTTPSFTSPNLTTPSALSSPSPGSPATFTPSSFTPLGMTPGMASGTPFPGPGSSSGVGLAANRPAPSLARGPMSGSSSDTGQRDNRPVSDGPSGGSASGSSASGGFIPPMMPPMAGGGGGGGGGVRPGEAGSRGGAALRAGGRDGRRAALRPQLAGRSGDREEKPAEVQRPTDGNLLDEELWQVPGAQPLPAPPQPARRRPPRET
ncbi:hypothetical protein [Labedaea rhizosphaerae]|uniref:Uncharacterized protein n=1 Tax=Labedaea rhizosphaerae TaxID=598644 RepID=A0A4R6SM06_LABRH|nr:hypothetical protein [Labedaea rhizosphaerae]TDQ04924.1 hypothetical protein EV186_101885 [Labedaea rhizosphaerae]